MRLARKTVAVVLLAGIATLAYSQPQAPKPVPVSDATKATVQANNAFACNIFRELSRENADKNLFFSPWSISSALGMTMEGARNDTALQMGKVLGLANDLRQDGERPWRLDSYHQGFADLHRRLSPTRDLVKEEATRKRIAELRKELNHLHQELLRRKTAEFEKKAMHVADQINTLEKQVSQYELNIANAIWAQKGFPFDPNYFDAVTRQYGEGLVREADFFNSFPTERLRVNRWVEEQTKDKIRDLIPELRPDEAKLVRMILVNAIYFKGMWNEPFRKEWTKEEPFIRANGMKSDVTLMQNTLPGRYAAFNADGSYFETPMVVPITGGERTDPDGNGFLIADLPYKGNKLAMTVLLPQDPKGLPALEKMLDGATLNAFLSKLQARNVRVWLPKFKLDTSYRLAANLHKLGMKQAFDPDKADFFGMTRSREEKDRLHISHVLHKAFVDVNEEGTEAAAATAVIMSVRPVSKPTTVPFTPNVRADHPFVFLIRDVDTGAILFMGRMTAPGK